MMMTPPQVVGVLLKKPGEQSHSRLSPLDPQETKIRGELYVEDLNERRIVSIRMGWLWVEGTQMRLPLRALNLRQATPGICQPHVLALGFTLSNSQGDLLATFWADTEPIYWSWVRAIAAELVRQTPFRAQRCLNFLEILTICPRGPVPLPDSPTETRRRSRSELRCWLGDSPMSAKSASILEDSRRRARSELRGWSSSNSSDEDLHLSEFRSIKTTLLPKVETVRSARTWGCSESSEGSDDSLPWGAGCRSSVDSIDSAPSIPEADTRELRIQRYKEVRRRENEARSRRVLEEDAKRRKARQEENNNNNNNEEKTGKTRDATQRCSRLCDDAKNNGNNANTTSSNTRIVAILSDEVSSRLSDTTASNKITELEKLSKNNRHNAKTTNTTVPRSLDRNADVLERRLSATRKDSVRTESQDNASRDNRKNPETTKITTTNSFGKMAENREKAVRRLSETTRDEDTPSKNRRNNTETTKTTRSIVSAATEIVKEAVTALEQEKVFRNFRNNSERTIITETTTRCIARATETTKTTMDPFARAAETVDAITRRLPPLRVSKDSSIVRFRENDGHRKEEAKNNSNKATSNNNNREASTRCKTEGSPPSPGVARTDSGERRSRARERRNVREKSQISIAQQPRIPEISLKTSFLQEPTDQLGLMSRIPVASQGSGRTSSNPRILKKTFDCRERGAISLPRAPTFALVEEKSPSSCEEDVARLLARCQRVDRYVPVREKLTLFESLSRMGGRLARSTEDLGRSSLRPSPNGKQRARSLHDLNRAARSVPVLEMCRLFEGEQSSGSPLIVVSTGQVRFSDSSTGKTCWKDPPTSILKNNGNQDVPPCVRTSTRRKHYQK